MNKTLSLILFFGVFLFVGVAFTQESDVFIDTSSSVKALGHPTTFGILVQRAEVQKELELAGPQIKAIELSLKKIREHRVENRKASRGVTNREEMTRLRDALYANMASEIELLKKELLPHQNERLEQIAFQYHLAIKDPENARVAISLMASPDVVAGLKMTDLQRQEIEQVYRKRDEAIRKIYAEYAERFNRIQTESQRKILSALDKKQQAEVEAKLGPPATIFFAPDRVGSMLQEKR